MALVTPYSWAKGKGDIRPQQVYQYCTKLGCPHKVIAGKIYIEPAEVEKWLKGRQTQKEQKVKKSDAVASARRELVDLLLQQKPKVGKGWCVRCHKETTFHQEVQWTDGDLFGQYYECSCTDCGYACYHNLEERVHAYEFLKGTLDFPFPPKCCPNPAAEAQMQGVWESEHQSWEKTA
jgi:hypothetical protein